MKIHTRLTCACALFATLLGCVGGANLQLVEEGPSGPRRGPALSITFGATVLGRRSSPVTVFLENAGATPLTVRGSSLEDEASGADFSVETQLPVTLAPSARQPVTLTFHPRYVEGPDRELVAQVHFDVARGPARTLTLRGTGLGHDCAVPATVDFSGLEVGASSTRTLELANDTDEATELELVELSPEGPSASFTSISALPARIPVPARGVGTATIRFAPVESGTSTSRLVVRRSAGCPTQIVRLTGDGVFPCVGWAAQPSDDPVSQSTLTFAPLEPGARATGAIHFHNRCARDVRLTELRLLGPAFTLGVDAGAPFVVPAQRRRDDAGVLVPEQAVLPVSFAPLTIGAVRTQLSARTDLAGQSGLVIPVSGTGALAPRLELSPERLDFGLVPVAPTDGGSPTAALTLRVRNVGSGTNLLSRPLEVTLFADAGAGTRDDELCLGDQPQPGQPCPQTLAGQPLVSRSLARGEELAVPVRLTPRSAGAKAWSIHVSSNDPRRPTAQLDVRAEALEAPDCRYAAGPPLDFGAVAAPKRRELAFELRNLGTAPCRFSGLRVPGAAADWLGVGLDAGAVLEVAPSQSALVPVTLTPPLTPRAPGLQGSVDFNVLTATAPVATLPVTAQAQRTCLALLVDDLDFGATSVGCAAERTVQLANLCAGALSLSSARFTLNAPAGVDGGVPFELAGGDTTSALPPYALRPLTLRYRPASDGAHRGAFAVRAQAGGAMQTQLVLLRGTANASREQEDRFVQPRLTPADVLLIVDNSSGTAVIQTRLGERWHTFSRYADLTQLDLQLGVTTTDDELTGERGRLRRTPGGVAVISQRTSLNADLFSALVNAGELGSAAERCLSPAVQALTSAVTEDPTGNGALLRDEASLGVVAFTDEAEQSPLPVAHYVAQLLNVKGRRTNAFSYSTFGPFDFDGGCISIVDLDQPPAGRHSMAVSALHGVREDVCAVADGLPSGDAALERAGRLAAGWRDRILLTSRPAPGVTPTVSVDGQSVPGGSAWAYDAVSNAVLFSPSAVPAPGQVVQLRYATACLP